jgi:hypothetical protein
MTSRDRLLHFLALALAVGAIAGIHFFELPSETTTLGVLVLLTSLVALSGCLIWFGLSFLTNKEARFALAGLGLLGIGTVLALSVLPESSTGATPGGVGVMPPFAARPNRGFEVGLAVHPNGCRNPVSITLVVAGSSGFWKEHQAARDKSLPFVVVLPGTYERGLTVRLGPKSTSASSPQLAEVDNGAMRQLRHLQVVYADTSANPRNLTVVTGSVVGWPSTQRPLVINARAQWITRRGVGNCNLALPALSGETSAKTLVKAIPCRQLQEYLGPALCTPPPSDELSRALEVGKAVSVVTGDVSSTDSDPQPTIVHGTADWECEAQSATESPTADRTVAGGIASEGSDSDCHAVAAVVSSSWHRDFLIVLIGAFIAVGVHMLFQAMIEGRTSAKHRRATQE